MKLNIDDIIASLQNLDNNERTRLQNALFELQNDLDLKEAIQEGLADVKSGRVSSHNFGNEGNKGETQFVGFRIPIAIGADVRIRIYFYCGIRNFECEMFGFRSRSIVRRLS